MHDWKGPSATVSPSAATINSATTGITVANASTGVSGTNANLQPSLGVFFIIKI